LIEHKSLSPFHMLGEYFTPSNYIMLDYGGRQKTLNHLLSQLGHH